MCILCQVAISERPMSSVLSELHASAATGTAGATITRVLCFISIERMVSMTLQGMRLSP
ncbi:hypothetical protein ARMGADRAFT_1011917 [Armillaria gallica]|uniref:Uncharacterized protein n=1 Tax=Armillaria gallica TaxID=47427 RepID=A0A2H3E3W9_ARMGA|nr:hypothetical protein ARMGADRAFT_1011917 [Armillaria gallica]